MKKCLQYLERVRLPHVLILAMAIFAVGGGAATAAKLITSKDIRNGTIKTVDLSSSAKRSLKGQTGPVGRTGAPGPAGPAGPAGAGVSGLTVVESAKVDLAPGTVTPANWVAQCPAGTRVIGTGFYSSIASIGFVKAYTTLVGGAAFNDTGVTATGLHLQAICAAVPGVTATAAASSALIKFKRDRNAAIAEAK